jgi:nucleotide-binding universal stress UspA family protein
MVEREVRKMFKRILLAYDGAPAAHKALLAVAELAATGQSELHIVSVGRLPEYAESEDEVEEAREQAEEFYQKRLDEAVRVAVGRGVAAKVHMLFGKPSEQILAAAESIPADLIVLSAHLHHPLRRRILGGTAGKIVDWANCSVLVIR